MITNMIIDN